MKFLKIILLQSLLFIASCSVPFAYQQPEPTSTVATIEGKREQGLKTFDFFVVKAIDNQNIGLVWSETSKIRLLRGNHRIKAKFIFSDPGFFSNQAQTAILDLNLKAKSGEAYRLNGSINGAHIIGWIEDIRGHVVVKAAANSLPLGSELVDVPEMQR